MKFDYLPIFAADADMWEADGLSLEDEDALVLALWRFYRGRPEPEGLSIFAKLIYSPIVKRWESQRDKSSKRALAGKLGGLKTQEQNRLAKAIAKANDKAFDKANASSKTSSNLDKALAKPTTTTTTTTTTNTSTSKIKEKQEKETPTSGDVILIEERFDEFWQAYPTYRRVDKKKCREKFMRIIKKSKDPDMFQKIMEGLNRWKQSEQWNSEGGKFVCAPIVWLNNERWDSAPNKIGVNYGKNKSNTTNQNYQNTTTDGLF